MAKNSSSLYHPRQGKRNPVTVTIERGSAWALSPKTERIASRQKRDLGERHARWLQSRASREL